MKPNMGGVKEFINIEYDGEGNEIEVLVEENEVEVNFNLILEDENEEVNVNAEKNEVDDVVDDFVSDEAATTSKEIVEHNNLHNRITENIRSNQEKSANKMEHKHNHKRNKKTVEYEIGNSVALKKTKIDVGGTELKRLIAVVTGKTIGKKFTNYDLTCEYGKLNSKYTSDDLELYHGLIEFDVSSITEMISLREAIIRSAERDKPLNEIEVKCDCKSKCTTNKCKCFQKKLKCNSHCHYKNSIDCKTYENKD